MGTMSKFLFMCVRRKSLHRAFHTAHHVVTHLVHISTRPLSRELKIVSRGEIRYEDTPVTDTSEKYYVWWNIHGIRKYVEAGPADHSWVSTDTSRKHRLPSLSNRLPPKCRPILSRFRPPAVCRLLSVPPPRVEGPAVSRPPPGPLYGNALPPPCPPLGPPCVSLFLPSPFWLPSLPCPPPHEGGPLPYAPPPCCVTTVFVCCFFLEVSSTGAKLPL